METIGTLLDERLVVLDADVSSAEDCIRLMAGLFEQYGYVQPGYGDAVAAREKEYPTGLPGKGINLAIPHTCLLYTSGGINGTEKPTDLYPAQSAGRGP